MSDPAADPAGISVSNGLTVVIVRREERAAVDLKRRPDSSTDLEGLQTDERTLSAAFDAAWAESLVRQAAERMAGEAGTEAERRRVEILRLRFADDLPLREIAARLGEKAAQVHKQNARARAEFREALIAVLADHRPKATRVDLEAECFPLQSLLA